MSTKPKRKRFIVQTQNGEIVTYKKKWDGVTKTMHKFVPNHKKRGPKGMRRIVGSFDTMKEAKAFAGTSGRWAIIDTGEQT